MTTDTSQVEEYEDYLEDIETIIYVDKESSLLYEVRFFINFVLARPCCPTFYLALRKMSMAEFVDNFDEYYGDHDEVRAVIRGMMPGITID